MRSVIVEGVDGTGKSTLAAHLAKKFGLRHMRNGPRPKNLIEARRYVNWQLLALRYGGYVVDRITPMSQVAYGACHGALNEDELHFFDESLNAMLIEQAVFIYCRTDRPKHTLEDYDDPDGAASVEPYIQEIMKAYEQRFATFNMKPLVYDMNADPDYKDIDQHLRTVL